MSPFRESLSARRAWIEMLVLVLGMPTSVVALRKESVDRNDAICADHHKRCVALRKESVDRNTFISYTIDNKSRSLSARRAWIEIDIPVGWWKMQNGRSPQGERG